MTSTYEIMAQFTYCGECDQEISAPMKGYWNEEDDFVTVGQIIICPLCGGKIQIFHW